MTFEECMRSDAQNEAKARAIAKERLEKKLREIAGNDKEIHYLHLDYEKYDLKDLGFEYFSEKEKYSGYKKKTSMGKTLYYDADRNMVKDRHFFYDDAESCTKTAIEGTSVKFVDKKAYKAFLPTYETYYKHNNIYSQGYLKYKEMHAATFQVPKVWESLLFNIFSVLSCVFALLFYVFSAVFWKDSAAEIYDVGRLYSINGFSSVNLPSFLIYAFLALALISAAASVAVYYGAV